MNESGGAVDNLVELIDGAIIEVSIRKKINRKGYLIKVTRGNTLYFSKQWPVQIDCAWMCVDPKSGLFTNCGCIR